MVVTGAAGFIGSHLAEALCSAGHSVIGIDSMTPYYSLTQKRSNLRTLEQDPNFSLLEVDLAAPVLREVIAGAEAVFHLAGQPGVRSSWGSGFDPYIDSNIRGTQRLLEAAAASSISRFVFASSSSIYGNADVYPVTEASLPRPHSPYGVSKLAAEHLCGLYATNWDLPVVSLRYFTVYGPRQRPDMAMHRLIESGLDGPAFPMYGSGAAIRDFTYVGDVVAANMAAMHMDCRPGTVLNVAGGSAVSMSDVISLLQSMVGSPIQIEHHPGSAGDVQRTGGSTEAAANVLGWRPLVGLEEGLRMQVDWHLSRRVARVTEGR